MCGSETGLAALDLVAGFRRGRQVRAVARASFEVPRGTVAAVVGPSGSGKTTLLRTMLGMLPPLSGSVTFDGLPCDVHRARHGIGYLPEALGFPAAWTPRGLLALAALAAGRDAAEATDRAVALAGIDFDLGEPLGRLSKGMRQRVALAVALVPRTSLLLLDEPEAGLDPAQRFLLRRRIRELAAEGLVIMIATHDVSGLAAVADRAFVIRGAEATEVAPAALAEPDLVLELFGYGEAQ